MENHGNKMAIPENQWGQNTEMWQTQSSADDLGMVWSVQPICGITGNGLYILGFTVLHYPKTMETLDPESVTKNTWKETFPHMLFMLS